MVVLVHGDGYTTPIVITARKRSLGQGNVFTPVCHSVHGLPRGWLGRLPSPSQSDTTGYGQ